METPVEYNAGNKPAEDKILVGVMRADGSRTHFENGYGVFGRAEIIDRMAKAFFYAEFKNADEGWKEATWSSKSVKETFYTQAAAVLDDLLKA